ncbi:S9 family peptidase [Parasediminibacterium sp. JCM 36343]|uniref:S9 family peptidase n=1 Tax=Parasediminibacterium sp. JCM 36343 TaxID=3374279 RepID=UPI00397A29FE
MRLSSLVFYLFASITVLQAQPSKGIHWSKEGNAYFEIENGGIVQIGLPEFSKKSILAKENLLDKATGKTIYIKNFFFSEDGSNILIYTNSKKVWRYETRGDYWVYNVATNSLVQIGKSLPTASLMFAKFSPDGSKVAYVSKHNIYAEDLATNTIQQLTFDGTDKIINGTFDWAYEEEFGCRDGFRWSADSKQIAYWQIDATHIRNFLLIDNTDSIYSFTKPVEYPKVGENPSSCKVGVVAVATAKTTWMNVPGDAVQHYIPRMEWAPSGQLIIQQLNRKQNESNIRLLNPTTGAASTIYTETDKAWIDIKSTWDDDNPKGWDFINKGKAFVWVSEKDGWRHLYAISMVGKKETLLTNGNYDITSVQAVDEQHGFVYFMASPNNATQRYLYKVPLNGKGTMDLVSPTGQKGVHGYEVSPNGLFAEHTFSSHNIAPISEWVSLPTHKTIKESSKKAVEDKDANVEMIQVTTEDNITLDGWMIKPTPFDSTKKYPVVFYVYTEPGEATVADKYGNVGNFLYYGDMAADGYIQISLDGRGTPTPKGAAWRKSIYRKVGILNIHDQAMAARKIMQWGFVDTSRIAVWGWSGGGSTTLNLLFQYPDIYKTGIAIAPVAYRLSYDNIYEERYMGLPQENRDDYIKASAITYTKGLKGNLLLIHGTGDDNVHYQNTELLINELVKYNKQFQLMSYPNRTHGLSEGAGTGLHLVTLYTKYLKEHCPGGGR